MFADVSLYFAVIFVLLLMVDWVVSVLCNTSPWLSPIVKRWYRWADERFNLTHGFTQIWIAFDQLLNVILCNPFSKETWADETISSRCGRMFYRYPYKFWRWIIDNLLFGWWQGPNHCVNAYKKERTRYHSPPEMRNPE